MCFPEVDVHLIKCQIKLHHDGRLTRQWLRTQRRHSADGNAGNPSTPAECRGRGRGRGLKVGWRREIPEVACGGREGGRGGGGGVSSHPQAAGDSPAGDGDTQLGRHETKGRSCSPRAERRPARVTWPGRGLGARPRGGVTSPRSSSPPLLVNIQSCTGNIERTTEFTPTSTLRGGTV